MATFLHPCQHLLVLLCLFNTISMVTIFKEPFKLFILSNFLCIMCLLIRGEILVEDQWILRAILILGLCIFLYFPLSLNSSRSKHYFLFLITKK